jgi:hypothetical protein
MPQIAFIQLADTHIGHRLMDNWMWPIAPFSGYNPHDDRLFAGLEQAFVAARTKGGLTAQQPLYVLMNGDLTAGGRANDFALALELLFARHPYVKWPAPESWGLGLVPEFVRFVPGNHDHWNSDLVQRGYQADICRKYLPPPTPWVHTWRDGSLAVEVYGIDSNSGFEDQRMNYNPWAGGKLSGNEQSRLTKLLQDSDQALGSVRPRPVRIFLCHHAMSNAFLPRPLDDPGRDLLLYFAGKHKVSAVLTGHNHAFPPTPWMQTSPADSTWRLMELRSASACAGKAKEGNHGFYLHRISVDNAQTKARWEAWRFQTADPLRFYAEPSPSIDFEIPLT